VDEKIFCQMYIAKQGMQITEMFFRHTLDSATEDRKVREEKWK